MFPHYITGPTQRPVLPGGRGHRQITQNMPYKKIMCGEKLVAVKVAVSSNKVLWYKFSSIWKICVIFNQKMESKNKKMTKSLPKHYVFFCFVVVVLWNIMHQQIFWEVTVKASKMAVVFGECLSGPGNTEWTKSKDIRKSHNTGNFDNRKNWQKRQNV